MRASMRVLYRAKRMGVQRLMYRAHFGGTYADRGRELK